MADYHLTRDALTDLKDIGAYTQREWEMDQRRKYLEDFESYFEHLSEMPGIGRKVSYLRAGMRAYPIGSHVVFYRQDKTGITVIRILHQSQNEMRAFKRGY